MLKINIPTPCHEDWNAMTPNTQGRHCNSCVKTVVDFTNMSDEEVKYFFLHKKEEKVCGRFRNEQLHRITIELPGNIFLLQIPLWKKFLAASLLVFSTTLFSCDTRLKGEVKATHEPTTTTVGTMVALPAAPLMGDTTVLPAPPVCTVTLGTPEVSVGMVAPQTDLPPANVIIKGGVDSMPDTIPVISKLTVILMGDVIEYVQDSVTIKKTVKKDSSNCDGQIFN